MSTNNNAEQTGFRFAEYIPRGDDKTPFERLLKLFTELLVYTSGDVEEAMRWLTEIDREHGLTDSNYGIANFAEDLKNKGFLREGKGMGGRLSVSARMEQVIRRNALDQIFGTLNKAGRGWHSTRFHGPKGEAGIERREFEFGDRADMIDFTESFKNAQIRHGKSDFFWDERDLVVRRREMLTNSSTVLMIDISHSMILYGEDRITPAKKVAMALAELIRINYPGDTLDFIVFGNEAWPITLAELPYLQVGPYHTNTVAGLELATEILRKRKNPNKQIFMITDGKPTCIKIGKGKEDYYRNSFGLDRRIVNKTLNLAGKCRRSGIRITTFMIARDPYLQKFVEDFTEACQGKAFYSSLQGLGEFVFEDYERNRRRTLR